MKKRSASMILMVAAVCACESGATMAWSKADATPHQFVQTRTQCHIQSIRSTYNLGGNLDGLFDIGRDDRFRSCMGANGWMLVSQPGGSAGW